MHRNRRHLWFMALLALLALMLAACTPAEGELPGTGDETPALETPGVVDETPGLAEETPGVLEETPGDALETPTEALGTPVGTPEDEETPGAIVGTPVGTPEDEETPVGTPEDEETPEAVGTPGTPVGTPGTPGAAVGTPGVELTSVDDLVSQLEDAGATVQVTGTTPQPMLGVDAQSLSVNGSPVQVFEFTSEQEAQEAADMILQGGEAILTQLGDATGTPHLFHSGQLLVLYVGEDQATVDMLSGVLGEQINEAGGTS